MVLNLSTNLVNALGNVVEWSPLFKKLQFLHVKVKN